MRLFITLLVFTLLICTVVYAGKEKKRNKVKKPQTVCYIGKYILILDIYHIIYAVVVLKVLKLYNK